MQPDPQQSMTPQVKLWSMKGFCLPGLQKKIQISQHGEVEWQWCSAFLGATELFRGRKKATSPIATLRCRVTFQPHAMRFAQLSSAFLGRGQHLFIVKILQGCSLKQNSFVSSVAISLLSWSRGSHVIPGSSMFAPSEGHSQGLCHKWNINAFHFPYTSFRFSTCLVPVPTPACRCRDFQEE